MRVLITGANGFIGAAMGRRFVAEGWTVAGAVRSRQPLPPGVEPRLVDPLGPATAWASALERVEAVVHLAGRSAPGRDVRGDLDAEFHRVNTEATLHLAREAAYRGVRHLVFMSSIKVNGEATGIRPFEDGDAPAPADAYARSKWATEQGLEALAGSGGGHFKVTIFRPPLVYGPGVRGNFLALMRLVAAGWPLPFGAIRNRRSLMFVGNLADAVTTVLKGPAAALETFLVGDGEDVSLPELLRRIARPMGRAARLWPVPPGWLETVGRLVGREDTVRRLTGSLQISGTNIHSRFGWRPPISLDRGIEETVAWFKGAR